MADAFGGYGEMRGDCRFTATPFLGSDHNYFHWPSVARISECSLISLFAKNSGKANGTEGLFEEAAVRLDDLDVEIDSQQFFQRQVSLHKWKPRA